jgi:hypothetical protein
VTKVGVEEVEVMLNAILVAFPLALIAISIMFSEVVTFRSAPEMKGTNTMLLEGASWAEGYVMLPVADLDVEMLRFMLKKKL